MRRRASPWMLGSSLNMPRIIRSGGARRKPHTSDVGGKSGQNPPFPAGLEAAGLGFEPRLPGPEPGVLPLDDPATTPILAGSLVLHVLEPVGVDESDFGEPALLEHAPRGRVLGQRDGDDPVQARLVEAVRNRRPGGLRRVALAPMRLEKAVADLDLGPSVEVLQACRADRRAVRAQVDGAMPNPCRS